MSDQPNVPIDLGNTSFRIAQKILGNAPKKNALVVEDDCQCRKLVCVMLESLGWSVSAFGTGEAALDYLRSNTPDMALIDLNLPGVGGLTVAKFIKAKSRNVMVVICSGAAEANDKALSQDFMVLPKPFTLDALERISHQAGVMV